jgi:hypothetical protein
LAYNSLCNNKNTSVQPICKPKTTIKGKYVGSSKKMDMGICNIKGNGVAKLTATNQPGNKETGIKTPEKKSVIAVLVHVNPRWLVVKKHIKLMQLTNTILKINPKIRLNKAKTNVPILGITKLFLKKTYSKPTIEKLTMD